MAGGKTAKKKKGNKARGHYCYVCGEHKANEKFSGSGHAKHICKKCQSLPLAKRNEMIALRKDDFRFPRYNRQSKKVVEIKTPVLFSELEESLKTEAIEQLEEMIGYFLADADHIPSVKDRDMVLRALCENISESLNQWEPTLSKQPAPVLIWHSNGSVLKSFMQRSDRRTKRPSRLQSNSECRKPGSI